MSSQVNIDKPLIIGPLSKTNKAFSLAWVRIIASIIAAIAVALVVPLFFNSYQVFILELVCVQIILVLGLNVLMGMTGLFAMAHVAFYGIGIYVAGLLTNTLHLPIILGIFIAGLVAALVGMIVGAISLRMRDLYLALSTFAFAEAMQWVFLNWKSATGGPDGLRIQDAWLLGSSISPRAGFFVVFAICLLFIVASTWLNRSLFGRAMFAVRESEPAASAFGIDVTRVKVISFTISAFYAGCAGGTMTVFTLFIHPEGLGFVVTVNTLVSLVVGGMGTVPGAIIGAIVMTILDEGLRKITYLREIAYGLILMTALTFMPTGIYGSMRDAMSRFRRSRR